MKCVVENSDVTEGDLSWDHIKKIFGNDYWGLDITHPQSHKSWRPLTTASFALNRVLYGLDPKSFHIGVLVEVLFRINYILSFKL
eukprot:m.195286 g.195286  ORF g.195286 m.195286 type:complete len:85 (+) comp15688_c0_seq4:75-329(+)